MDKETLTALKASIQHWRENEDAETVGDASITPDKCALCFLYFNKDCRGCPVKSASGVWGCNKTPYITACKSHINWHKNNTPENKSAFHTAAKAERELLESLLPGGSE